MPTSTVTIDGLIREHAPAVAYIAEEPAPATCLAEFTRQLAYAADRCDKAGIAGAGDLATAGPLLLEGAVETGAAAKSALLRRAAVLLRIVPEMADEYRDMVG
ncbi:hypothetical protein ACIRP5_11320 [Streptomyces sp. NPDC101221]|uniref:hypothetical protein n=1 Tax=Streptomyces sp. NPDC101221 TaxID=3366132 RepID=UPI0038292A6F